MTSTSKITPYNKAEYHKAKTILVHTPTKAELFMGILHPRAALFECPFDPQYAMKEHLSFVELLQSTGANVLNVKDVLLDGVDSDKEEEKKESLEGLQKLASKYLVYLPDELDSNSYKSEIINSLSPDVLADIILTHPIISLTETEKNTGLEASYSTQPLMNLYFLRDQSITTCKGVVMSNMNSLQRSDEVDIIEYVYHKLNVEILHKVSGSGRLEGGDFIPAGDIDFIGNGLRTNEEGVKQLISHNVFCANKLIVVKDYWHNQDQMHLDTYFNIMAPKKAVLVSNRLNAEHGDKLRLLADIYTKKGESYALEEANKDFVKLLKEDLGYKVVSVSVDDQLKYGVNFLTVESDQIIGIDGVSQEYKDSLSDIGVNATWIDFGNLTCGYGAAHCTTQVLTREEGVLDQHTEL